MKKLLFISLLLMTQALYALESPFLLLQGEYIGANNVECSVYKMTDDGKLELQYSFKSKKFYECKLEVKSCYVIKFKHKRFGEKVLYVDAVVSKRFSVGVDFNTEENAYLMYNKEAKRYYLALNEDNSNEEKD